MPIQSPQRNDYLNCPICDLQFGPYQRAPISLPCGHTFCYHCLYLQKTEKCPIDQTTVSLPADEAVVNTALLQLVGIGPPKRVVRPSRMSNLTEEEARAYESIIRFLESIALHLQPELVSGNVVVQRLSRPMERRIVALLFCCLSDEDALERVCRPIRNLAERVINELITLYQHQGQLSANLWAAVRARGCQFLGPGVQEEVLKLILLALEDGSALSRKVLVMFVVQRLEVHFPQASKTSIGHVVQLLYRASCFRVSKRVANSSLMQLKDEYRTYCSLRREHDSQIVQIAHESGLRIAPEQWSALLYGDASHKSQMQSIIDKLQSPRVLANSVQELQLAMHRHGNVTAMHRINTHLAPIAALDNIEDGAVEMTWERLSIVMHSLNSLVDILHEPPPPPMPHSMPRDGDEILRKINDQDLENDFGDQRDSEDQEFDDHQDYSDEQQDQNEDGYQQDYQDNYNDNQDYHDQYNDNQDYQDQFNDNQDYLDQQDHADHYNNHEGNNGQDDPPEVLYGDEPEYEDEDELNDDDYHEGPNHVNGGDYAQHDIHLYHEYDDQDQGDQEGPIDGPPMPIMPPPMGLQPFPGAFNQQPIVAPHRLPIMDPRMPRPFYHPVWLAPNGYIYPYRHEMFVRPNYVPQMPEYVAPPMAPLLPVGRLAYPEGQNDDLDMPGPQPHMEMLYNDPMPAGPPYVGPYYQYMDNIHLIQQVMPPVIYGPGPNNGNDIAQARADVPAPPAQGQDVAGAAWDNHQENRAFNFRAMAGALPDVAQFPAPAPIRDQVLARPLPMVHMGPVFPAPILAPGRIGAPVPGQNPFQGPAPVHVPARGQAPILPLGHVPVAAPEPEQVSAPVAPAAAPVLAPGPAAADQEQIGVEDNRLYEEDIAQSIQYLERLLDIDYDN